MADPAEFAEFVAARSERLLGTAYLLTGDLPLAEDLLQEALTRSWFVWRRLDEQPETYVRKVIVDAHTSWWRRHWRGPKPTGQAPESARGIDVSESIHEREVLRQALRRLSPRQRAVLVLRLHDGLDEAETARVLGCPVSTVNSLITQALARLRTDPLFLHTRR